MGCALALVATVVWAVSRPQGGADGTGRAHASASPARKLDGTVACPGPAPPGTVMRVHIDKRVDGARGSVRADSDPSLDPDQDDNTAPVTVTYLP
ncbi:hypothetical protein ACF1B0_00720 [Streptomyces anandii]|uniref:hypothetical protein n=1 Tax=Streptomyces anandii TaxID=285454 RepID=UPI0036FC2F3D